jgi:hypothetical protein
METKSFETEQDLIRERKAVERFVSIFKGGFEKLSPDDIDYKIFDKKGTLIAYVEVKGRLKNISRAYPLPISIFKVTKLWAKRLNPTVIWACDDGIIYGKLKELHGTVCVGGRKPRDGSPYDIELMVYYDKQKALKYIRYA